MMYRNSENAIREDFYEENERNLKERLTALTTNTVNNDDSLSTMCLSNSGPKPDRQKVKSELEAFSKEKMLLETDSDEHDDRQSLYFDANKLSIRPQDDFEDAGIANLFIRNTKIVVTQDMKDNFSMRRRKKRK